MVVEMQCTNARSAGEKCKAGMVRAGGKGISLPLIHRMLTSENPPVFVIGRVNLGAHGAERKF